MEYKVALLTEWIFIVMWHLNQLQQSINDESQQIAQLRENRATIQGKLENYTTDAISLQADLDLAERKFERRKLEYTALEMAERTLKTVIAQQDQNPFEAFETETAAMFEVTCFTLLWFRNRGFPPASGFVSHRNLFQDHW